MIDRIDKNYIYAKSKENLETYIALTEEACSHIEELRLNCERLLETIKEQLRQREEGKLDETESIDAVLDFYISRSKALDKVLDFYGW